MSRRSTILESSDRDGTSQRGRSSPALDPTSVGIDERGHAELLAFVQQLAERLRFFTADDADTVPREVGTWAAFASHPDVSIADMTAYLADPRTQDPARARWLARPHFALLLAFLELLGHARTQLNDLTRRHLEYYYRDVLQLLPEPPVPDRVVVLLRPATRVAQVLLPAGTEFQAGRDSAGVLRVYRSERAIVVNRARIDGLRAVHIHRTSTGIPDVRKDRKLPVDEVFERMLALALGEPGPGDPIPKWAGAAVDIAAVRGLRPWLDFAEQRLFLAHHELRTLMQLVRRRAAADREWAEINRLLGLVDPAHPRDFAANFAAVVGVLDYKADGLPQVDNLDDLYVHRSEPAVDQYIRDHLAIGPDNFAAMMQIKRRIDAEWAEVVRLLERAGRRQRGLLTWTFQPADPTAFAANLAAALGGAWPPPWPPGVADITAYEARLRALEDHFALPIEQLGALVDFAEHLPERGSPAWTTLDRLLAGAHREKFHAARRARLAAVRAGRDDLAGFDAEVEAALGPPKPLGWDEAHARLARHLDRGLLDLLDQFRSQLVDPAAPMRSWADVDRVLELAQRYTEDLPEPVARRDQWRDVHAIDDVTAQIDDPAVPRWRTFGRPAPADPGLPPTTMLGWSVSSSLLALSQGARTVTLTLGLAPFDRPDFLRELGLPPGPGAVDPAALLSALAEAVRFEVTCATGWQELTPTAARLASGAPDDDYWSIHGAARPLPEDRPALQCRLVAGPTTPALAPITGTGAAVPTLRMTLRHHWDPAARLWTSRFAPFAPLVLTAVHLRVDVDGLADLRLQHEDRPLDPRGPFEPFGARPLVGTRLYLSHPELVRNRLDAVRFDLEWMGLPTSLRDHYLGWPDDLHADSFRVRVDLRERGRELALADLALFTESGEDARTATTRALVIPDVPAALALAAPGLTYAPSPALAPGRDLRADDRVLIWELSPTDFGDALYPSLAVAHARELAVALARDTDLPGPAPLPPYTPTLKRLRVAYTASLELPPDACDHVHPFGVARIDLASVDPADRRLLPAYASAGELYIGLRELAAPQRLALLLQLAEGTSDPDLEPTPVTWSVLDGDRWRPLDVLHDSTRGLINSGIVELAIPEVATGALLPADRTWLRIAIARNPASVCDAVAIHAQAVTLRFDDRGNAPDHHDQPLPVAGVGRLLAPNPQIAEVVQPYTSFGGRPGERPERFATRVSERLRHKQRALAPWDYERLVLERFAGIHKVRCLTAIEALQRPRSAEPAPGLVEVVVIPDIRDQLPSDAFAPRAPANLLADIQAYLGERAPAAAEVCVRNARYIAVSVILSVRFRPGEDERFARQRLADDLNRFLSPWAYDEGAELTIGGKIYANSLLDFVDRREYVDYVADIKLARSDDGENFELLQPTADDYHVATDAPDQVLVAARTHSISVISELEFAQTLTTGIEFVKLELDFIVG